MWILFTVLAALFQTFRNLFSKKLSGRVSSPLASLCRFTFGAPLAVAAALLLAAAGNRIQADLIRYILMCTAMAAFQLLANILLIELFKLKNFAISMTLIKTEGIILAVLGVFTLEEIPSALGWAGIITATIGLVCAGSGKTDKKLSFREKMNGLLSRSSLLAVGAGASLALCSVFLKKSYTHIHSNSQLMEVAVTLAVIMCIQTVISFLLLKKNDRKQIRQIIRMPLQAFLTGLFAVLGSFCWFAAFSMMLAAYVRTLGQVEFIFGLAVSVLLFREKIGVTELAGMAGVVAGTVLIVIA